MDYNEQLAQLQKDLLNAETPEELNKIEFKIKKLKMQQELDSMVPTEEADYEVAIDDYVEDLNEESPPLSTDSMVVDLNKDLNDNARNVGQSMLRKTFQKGHCPRCGSTRIDIWQQGIKPKKSLVRAGLALTTMGASTLVTGKKRDTFHCKDCGYTWETKAKKK